MPTPRTNLLCAVAILAALAGTTTVASADEAGPITRVRSSDAAIRELIERSRGDSATFNRLVDAIGATDGIVYIERGRCSPGIRSCLLLSMTYAAQYRVLRIAVDTRRPSRDLAGSIGHELRHALEVLQDPAVTSGAAMFFFYKNHGNVLKGIFETPAAIAAGNTVRAELARRPADDSPSDATLALAHVHDAVSTAHVRPEP